MLSPNSDLFERNSNMSIQTVHVINTSFSQDERDAGITAPGWYFMDETVSYNGPYPTNDEAVLAFEEYSETLLLTKKELP